jgi:hypothetical protein
VRYAAVNGAVTVLRYGLSSLVIDEATGRCSGVTTSSGQRLTCQALLANALVLRWADAARARRCAWPSRAIT